MAKQDTVLGLFHSHIYRNFCEDWTHGFWDMRADRHRDM